MTLDDKEFNRESLESLSSQQLDALLQQETAKEDMDESLVWDILTVLERREAHVPVQTNVDVEKAWQEFKTYYMHPHKPEDQPESKVIKKGQKHWILKTAAVAAVACIVIFAAPKAMGVENIFTLLGRWSQSVFEFFSPTDPAASDEVYVFKTDHPGLQELYDAVVAEGVTQPVVPMWLPEGYTLDEVKITRTPTGKKIFATYLNVDYYITVSIRIENAGNVVSQFPKDDSSVSVYEISDIKHYILNNEENCVVAWAVSNLESSISTNLLEADLRRILRSVY